ncbi:YbaB/EbfC family nucleoid-associated protein [Kutzneria chonburiensis]|uniref:YbaB/EbfC family nucleoid-associated protein n=1 Tax=Kutzneria chonburiensis TaxID=1483604 RepID=A0ABV6N9D1_9PSEU|nr:YbaB/EbfC family nucleoid-associated protein [Kutzneria chonburiensis]
MTDSEQMAELLARNAAMLDSMSQLLTSAREQLADAQRLNRDLRNRTGLAQSPDRMVTVVVDGVGGLRQLSFDRDAFEHHTPASLADAVTAAVREAMGQAAEEDVVAPVLESDLLPELDEPPAAEVVPDEIPMDLSVGSPEPQLESQLEPPLEPALEPDPVPIPVAIQDPVPPAAGQTSDNGSQIEHVVSALSKLPSYTGVVTRVLGVRDPERAAAIAAEYQLGDTIVERTFLSTSANPAYTGDGLVRYTIDARSGGKLIGAISEDGEQFGEVVFGPGAAFRVTGKRYYPSIKGWDIALEELG